MQPIVSTLLCAMWVMQGSFSQFLSSPFVFLNVLIFDVNNYGIYSNENQSLFSFSKYGVNVIKKSMEFML